ncbi:MAG: PCRF domain-containing protein [Clostridiales bacterium]|nr:PCRF domain-containing protein [Clostridiales bacterium]
MYGIYGEIIDAAEKSAEEFRKAEELLEYPEVQADKAHYLSVLTEYNKLKSIADKLERLKKLLDSEREAAALIQECNDSERDELYAEISSLKRDASKLASAISDELGCKHTVERALLRFKFTAPSELGVRFSAMIKEYIISRGGFLTDEKTEHGKNGSPFGISFTAEGEDIISRLSPLTGAHRVYMSGARTEELCFAVTPAEERLTVSDDELKITVTHSSGAGGQHINKVETAVRVTHIPTGLTVVCQDERSQLENKKRAIETIKRRLISSRERAEKSRIEADIYSQYKAKNTPISFDYAKGTMTDTRLKAFSDVAFPLKEPAAYIDGLNALCQ